jgi:hypothetical protein
MYIQHAKYIQIRINTKSKNTVTQMHKNIKSKNTLTQIH